MDLSRNTAIWRRVTRLFGQKLVPPQPVGDPFVGQGFDPVGEEGGAGDVGEVAGAGRRNVTKAVLRLQQEHRHLLAFGPLVDAVEAAADADRDVFETSVATKAWNCWPPGTSRKSATQPFSRTPMLATGLDDDVVHRARREGR